MGKIDRKKHYSRLKKIIITGIIRSTQFNNLNDRLREMYSKSMPVLYSIPIIHMDPQQAESITEYITAF
ncbi:hypothetical protein GCM10022393_40390 [Aquimarina addita]|uniref:Uncharacterized protein n=2 Tax=Aquimarina addita TaxID=870485 RepID=A0ABP6UTB7_9FLAO